jgi:phage tail-like protein
MSDTSFGFNGDIPTTSTFLFEVDGEAIGMFTEVTGLEVHVEVATYEEGGENGFVHQLPGRMTWPHIVLKRGVTNNDTLFSWVNQASGSEFAKNSNKLTRDSGAITLIGSDGTRLRSWEFQGVFAVRWTGPHLVVGSNELAAEELEIAHHGFTSKTF